MEEKVVMAVSPTGGMEAVIVPSLSTDKVPDKECTSIEEVLSELKLKIIDVGSILSALFPIEGKFPETEEEIQSRATLYMEGAIKIGDALSCNEDIEGMPTGFVFSSVNNWLLCHINEIIDRITKGESEDAESNTEQ